MSNTSEQVTLATELCSGLCAGFFLINSKDGDSRVSLGNLSQCSTTLAVKKKKIHVFKQNLLHFNLCSLPLVLSLEISKKCLAMLPLPLPIRLLFSSYFSMLQLVKISCIIKMVSTHLGHFGLKYGLNFLEL